MHFSLAGAVAASALLAGTAAQADLVKRCRVCPDYVPECSANQCPTDQVCAFIAQTCDECAKTSCVAPSVAASLTAGPTIYPTLPSPNSFPPSSFSLMPLPSGVTPSPVVTEHSATASGQSALSTSAAGSTSAAAATTPASTPAGSSAAPTSSGPAQASSNPAAVATPFAGMGLAVAAAIGALL